MLPLWWYWAYKKHCKVQKHLVKLYQDSLLTSNTAMVSDYLEIQEDLTQYDRDPPPTPPEVHLVTSLTPIHSLSDEHTCILDSGTSHTILKDKQYFQEIYPSNRPVTTITGVNHIEEGHGPAQ